jgi:hypothetical protein
MNFSRSERNIAGSGSEKPKRRRIQILKDVTQSVCLQKVKAALKKLEEEEKRASMLLKMDERKRPYNSMTETKVQPVILPLNRCSLSDITYFGSGLLHDYQEFQIGILYRIRILP